MSLAPGQRLGAFEIIGQLGAGGMGEVYRALDSKLDRHVAIKVLPAHLSERPDLLARFEREARLLAALDHPHIGTIYGLEEEKELRFLVMELIEGETLATRLERGALPLREALQVAIEIAEALEAAHAKHVVHRDLKPSNVMLTKAGRVKLLDFGLGKRLEEDAYDSSLRTVTVSADLTMEGIAMGTAPYMSPEQARGEVIDHGTDIWAFGCVAYEVLTGRRAFPGRTYSDSIAAVLESEPDWQLLPKTTPALATSLLRRCIQKDRNRRLRDIADARIEIDEALSDSSGVMATDPQLVVASPSAWRYAHLGATMLLLLVSAVLAFFLARDAAFDTPVMRFEIPAPEGTTFHLDPEIPGPAVVSPNGRMVTFTARDPKGRVQLYVRPLDATQARVLPGTENAYFPFWSPDSAFVGFFADRKLKKVAVAGGSSLILCDAPAGKGGSWSREGTIIFPPGGNTPLHRVADTGGESTPITQLDPNRKDSSHRFPHFLPDGQHFLYLAPTRGPGESAVLAGALRGGEEKLLMISLAQAAYASGHLLFLDAEKRTLMAQPFDPKSLSLSGEALPVAEKVRLDGDAHHAVYSASHSGVLAYQTQASRAGSKLEWIDREGVLTGSLGEPDSYVEVHLSPDEAHAAVSIRASGSLDVWVYDIARNTRSRFTFGPDNWLPCWSPDGSELVFTSSREGGIGLYRKSLGGEETLLLESEAEKFAESWSPDGSFVAFGHYPKGRWDIWILPLEGEREPYAFVETPFEDSGPKFSPDGRWLAYHSTESGRWEVYVTPFPGPGRKWQISTGGGAWTRWRADSKEIFYHGVDGRLMAVEVGVRDGAFVVGKAEPLFYLSEFGHFPTYAASRDGQRFLVVRPEKDQGDHSLTLVVNWMAELDRD